MFLHVLCFLLFLLLPFILVEELYSQNRNTTDLEMLQEDRYSLHVGPHWAINYNSNTCLIKTQKYISFVNESLYLTALIKTAVCRGL